MAGGQPSPSLREGRGGALSARFVLAESPLYPIAQPRDPHTFSPHSSSKTAWTPWRAGAR